ncbi:uncharacterized protein LOC123564921 [Mercenaria mercenaria]|uniref:uncharacterized protein LOC123564921 n=1 Tax=Mercenaria mercenaria TaxID=6596 RepID=UPI00234EC188|nr:uncharacterized protein LOC123564921 [Mercenaria mercenaria]
MTTDWLSIYCTGENVADWLAEYVAYGFKYKHACSINNMSLKCYFNQVFKGNGTHRLNDETIIEYNSWAKRLTTDWFACTKDEMPRLQRLFPQCTSPWQDVLLTDWLYNSVYYKPGLWLYPEQMSQLLALKEEAVNRTQSFEYYSDF